MNNAPIGIFDSGKGGLTVLDQVKKQLPQESVIYYGDIARVPYGSKTPEEIIAFNTEIITYFMERGVKMVIIACNTSSAVALESNQYRFTVPIVGLIHPGAYAALKVTRNNVIGVAATERTVLSHAYQKQLERFALERSGAAGRPLKVVEVACPDFVPLVEAGTTEGPEARAAVKKYLQTFKDEGVDTVIYGCTHYPYLEKEMSAFMGSSVTFVDPAVDTVKEAVQRLQEKDLLAKNKAPVYEYVASKYEGGSYVRVDGREYFFSSTPARR